MTATLITSKIEKEGQITIPIELREKLGLKEGDIVTLLEAGGGILISTQENIGLELLDHLGQSLLESGTTLDEIVESGRDIRGELMQEKYGLTEQQWNEKE